MSATPPLSRRGLARGEPFLILFVTGGWLLAGVLYLALVALVARAPGARAMLGFSSHPRAGPEAPAAPAPVPEATG
jgi:hypothetical protein